jgi:hypothetical protein
VQLLPADRLPQIAARILAAQPEPPRKVGVNDILELSGPVLIYLPVPPVTIAALVFLIPGINKLLLLPIALLGLLTIVAWLGLQIVPLVLALRRGRADVGTITDVRLLPRGGYRGRLRLKHGAGKEPVDFYSLSLKQLRVGDALNVLVDPASGKVAATLGKKDRRD